MAKHIKVLLDFVPVYERSPRFGYGNLVVHRDGSILTDLGVRIMPHCEVSDEDERREWA